ncbi:MAG: tryptophan 7-halogenase [Sandaracinaceae bacterium]|nr:tryptophan 7-halogenase [Sandaracinaceae bacterium]
MKKVDVAILGGGLAGNLLARQLRREVPGASVMVIEQSHERGWKVGESTVEIAAHYLGVKLGLSTYLYDQHLPKNGLRFFFDTDRRDATLTQMSEVGTDRPPPTPSFQLDRARIEQDLLRMNTEDGVDVRVGAPARNLDLDARTFALEGETIGARWIVDGTGRASTIARMRDLRLPMEAVHPIASVWGRYEGVRDFDDVPDRAWRARSRYVARSLSTNHFMYPGYWIWFIPLGRGVTSVGIVGEKHVFKRGSRTPEGFLSLVREHGAPAAMMEGARPLDLEGFTQLAYATKRFFHGGERWALLGDAGAFHDPFYSPGSDFISLECDFTTDLIRRELAGEDVTDRARTYDAFMQFRYDATLLLYKDLYPCFGCYDLMRVKLNFDLGCYYNLWLDPIVKGEHLDEKFLMSELARGPETLAALEHFSKLFQRAREHLVATGAYYEKNLGEYNVGVDCLRHWLEEVGTPRKRRQIRERTEEVFNYGRREALKLLGEDDGKTLRLDELVPA